MRSRIEQIRWRVSLRDVLSRDGVALRKVGSRWAARCPLHEEKTPSFYLAEGRDGVERFKCFGCGKGGDVLDYWQLSRDTNLAGASEALCSIIGIAWETPVRKPAVHIEEVQLKPMDERTTRIWNEGLDWLAGAPVEQARLAEWRGWRVETVAKMVALRVMGMPIYRGKRREAFQVWVPGSGERESFQAGFHVHTKELKGRFRFEPVGIGSWPLVIGEIQTCQVLAVLEGQWDAISFYDALSDGMDFPHGLAVVGIRGASSWRKLMSYDWGQTVQAFVFAHGDMAGEEWLKPDSFVTALRLRCKAVHPFICTPNDDGLKDFNDVHRAYETTSAEWCEMLRSWCEKGLRKRRRRS